jgi:hypothetical protein
MDKLWENEEILRIMKEMISEASTKEAVCDCNYDIASEEWFNYIEDKYRKTLTDYELEMLVVKYNEERNKYPKRISR